MTSRDERQNRAARGRNYSHRHYHKKVAIPDEAQSCWRPLHVIQPSITTSSSNNSGRPNLAARVQTYSEVRQQNKNAPEEFRRKTQLSAKNACQWPMEALVSGTSFDVMSKVSRNPLVPLNS
jgi:hypothetical protein